MKIGKLEEKEIVRLLRHARSLDPSVSLGPKYGEDAAGIDLGGRHLVAASDPVTYATKEIGWYAVHVNANDVAATGAGPRWFLATILLPESTHAEQVDEIFAQIDDACQQLSVSLVGGHTEVTPGLLRPVVSGTMIGQAGPRGIIPTSGAREGDAIILTKGVCIEGTAYLALEKKEEARQALGETAWKRACRYLRSPGLSVVKDAHIARNHAGVHAMHDPTEGGLCMGLYELGRAAGLGVEIDGDEIHVFEEARVLCEHFGIDPLRTLASGALLVCVAADEAEALLEHYREQDIRAAVIGRMVPEGFRLFRKGLQYPLMREPRDEITRLFEERVDL